MKKLLLILICLFVYSPSHSKWEKIEVTVEGGHSTFINKDRIRIKGDNVFYWELHNLSEPINFNEKSEMTYIQGHCDEFKYKVLKIVGCLEPMGSGDCIDKQLTQDLRQWSYPTPYTVREFTLDKVCKLR